MTRRFALTVFTLLTACSANGPVTFHPISDTDRSARAALLDRDATGIADIRTKSGDTLVLQALPCSRALDTCAFEATRVSGTTGRHLGTFVGSIVAVDGFDDAGMPKLRVDGEPCNYVSAPSIDRPNGEYANLNLNAAAALKTARSTQQPAWKTASPASVAHLDLRARGARMPYRTARLAILPKSAIATLFTGHYDDDPFALVDGNGRVLLSQSGRLTVSPSKTNDASDLIVEHLESSLFFRYNNTHYVPAPCQAPPPPSF